MSTLLSAIRSRQPSATFVAAGLLIVIALLLLDLVSLRQAMLFLVGTALGVTLYHAAFGFTSAWRVFIKERRGAGLRAQMVMLALAVLLFFPALANGTLFGQPVTGFVSPVGTSVVVGAFLFGIGMQLGGGCASGTLFAAGGGNVRMLFTLLFFIIGSVTATQHIGWWFSLPSLPPVSLLQTLGLPVALILSLLLFALIATTTLWLEKRRHGSLETPVPSKRKGWQRFLHGPWPLIGGAVALALLNFLTLSLAGRPWGITSAFALWGAKAGQALGIPVTDWAFWQNPGNAKALAAPVWEDITSMMNIGIMLGALLAAGLAGRFAPSVRIPLRSLMAAIIGGLMLGYGSRLAYGCNIGAYFSGIASGSLHGWLWLVAAFAGNSLGVRLRPWFFPGERLPAVASSC